jgi:hypothetical protein
MSMFRKFGTPEIFGTWSVNMSTPGIRATMGPLQNVVRDVPLFCIAYAREWSRVWEFIHKTWAKDKLGGLRAFCWVTEYQERGAPHVHFVLWTKKTLDELIALNNSDNPEDIVVSCARRSTDAIVQDLITNFQLHTHRPDYCMRIRPNNADYCRFDFPRDQCDRTRIQGGRVLIRRTHEDTMVNNYNPDILRMAKSNIDIQLNFGNKPMSYICKYITKPAAVYKGTMQPQGLFNYVVLLLA